MNKRKELMLIQVSTGGADAVRIVDSIAGTESAWVESKVLYPYFWYSADCAAQTLFGKKPFSATCLVDGCSGLGATADPFVIVKSCPSTEEVLNVRTDVVQARKSAHRHLTHNLSRRLKILGNFDVTLTSHGLVYKTFWLVRCEDTLVMVDSMTAAMHTLGERAA